MSERSAVKSHVNPMDRLGVWRPWHGRGALLRDRFTVPWRNRG